MLMGKATALLRGRLRQFYARGMLTVTTHTPSRITARSQNPARLRERTGARLLPTLIAALLFVVPANAHADKFDDLLSKAGKARKAGNMELTASLLRKAIAMKPEPALFNNLGRVLEDLGDYQGAVDSYKKVTDNPSAPAELRSLDAARIATLQNKLSKGWILAKIATEGGETLVNGRPPAAAKGKEFPVPPGRANLEFKSFDGGTVAVLSRSFPLGKRTPLNIPLAGKLGSWGALTIGTLKTAPSLIKIDNYTIEGKAGLKELRVPAGRHEFKFSFGQQVIVLNLLVAAGEKMDVSEKLNTQLANVALRKKPVQVTESASISPWPYVLIAVGAVAGGVGGFLIADAGADRDEVLEATRDGRGVVTSITLADAQEVQDDADTKATAGIAVIGVGGAIMVGGIIWAILDATSETTGEGSVNVSLGWGSIGLSGSF